MTADEQRQTIEAQLRKLKKDDLVAHLGRLVEIVRDYNSGDSTEFEDSIVRYLEDDLYIRPFHEVKYQIAVTASVREIPDLTTVHDWVWRAFYDQFCTENCVFPEGEFEDHVRFSVRMVE